METRTAAHLFADQIRFETPSGTPFTARAESLSLDYTDEALTTCRLVFVVGPTQYQEVLRRWLFHLTPESRLPGGESFDSESDVRLEVRLDRDLLSRFGDAEGAEPAAALLLAEPLESILLSSESWYALHATQEVPLPDGMEGALHAGYSTTWAAVEARATRPEPARGSLLAEIAGYFRREGLDYDYEDGDHFIQSDFEGQNGDLEVYAFAREAPDQVVIYAVAPEPVPAEKRAAIAELLSRANYGLVLGNFELDFDDGEVRFRTSRSILQRPPKDDELHELIATNVSAMDLYLPAMEAVITTDISPAGAIDEVEGAAAD